MFLKPRILVITFSALGLFVFADLGAFQLSPSPPRESAQAKIARALSAAPPDIARAATVAEMDRDGKMTVLRTGTNGFTCMAGDPKGVGQPAMCEDEASIMQWSRDFAQHKSRPGNAVPGITYMLAGATQRSDSDPCDTTSKPIATAQTPEGFTSRLPTKMTLRSLRLISSERKNK